MARTRKGKKPIGYEYWSNRPGNRHGGWHVGPYAKKRTHRVERQQGEKETQDAETE